MSDVTIRLASTQDIEAIFSIRISVVENHLSRAQMAQMGITPETLAGLIAATPCAWVAEVDGVAAGFAMIDGEDASLFALFIRPEFEGRGIGRLLLAQAEATLFTQHAVIWLETSASSRAARFYASRGWAVTETLDGGDVRFEKRWG